MTINRFKTVYWDIINTCNANCKYCITGRNKPKEIKYLTLETLSSGLDKLLSAGYIDTKQTVISLYNWGEPFLHPNLDEIIQELNNRNLKYAFSTNASIVPNINKAFVKNLDHIIFSMPGFSQKSYDKIHGFNFEKIKANILQIVNDCRACGFKGDFVVSAHVYQFNLDELKEANKFFEKHKIRYNPYYAILNHWDDLVDLKDGKLSYDKLLDISQNLFMFKYEELIKNAPENYSCPQNDFLIIDEEANVLHCCQIPKENPEHWSGNILSDNLDDVISKRQNCAVCEKCLKTGLAYYINNSLITPEFYGCKIRKKQKSLIKKLFGRNRL